MIPGVQEVIPDVKEPKGHSVVTCASRLTTMMKTCRSTPLVRYGRLRRSRPSIELVN